MGIVREIHSAYGITLKGDYEVYHWYDGRDDDVIWRLWVNDREVYLGYGHFIIAQDSSGQYINMESDKDILCYWLSKNPMNDVQLEEFFTSPVKGYRGCLWKHRARNMMLNEKIEAQRKAEAEVKKAAEEVQLATLKAYADKKKYYMIREYSMVYFLKLNKKNLGAVGKIDDKFILDFARNHPRHGCDIVEEREITI